MNRIRAREEAIVPSHWRAEILNSLVQARKRGRVPDGRIQRFLRDLSSFQILMDNERSLAFWERVRSLAKGHRLTAYDTAYLELARRVDLPLATLDHDLQRAAYAERVPLLEAAP
ncbi:MAG: type II toxin-antitoxin system VapC family toxin [Acidobacteriota bacterium]|nr:type II toxin-antitoxin system VapC family toxin [Acidobacteriota bacterium]